MSAPMSDACVLALPGSEDCADRIAACLGDARVAVESRRFPDGERYLRVAGEVAGRDAIVVARLREPDPQLPALLFLADALRDLGAASVGLVAPYLPYMRQDARFRPGEAVTSHSVAKWIGGTFDWLATVDPHLHRIARLDALYRLPCAVVPSAPAIALWLQHHVARPHVVGPDAESVQWAREVAALVPCGASVLRKTRTGDRAVRIELPDLAPLAGRTPVLVDDIVSSAHTLAEAVRALRAAGLAAPVCVAVHAVFADGARELLADAGAAQVASCNTLVHPSNAIDVLPALAEAARALRAEARRPRR